MTFTFDFLMLPDLPDLEASGTSSSKEYPIKA